MLSLRTVIFCSADFRLSEQ
uniref:Uncharacterized protein n=1 Tax=Anguilla anguilla TaxID=7936 RepID=A0A0E9R374_ANGAN